MTSTPSFRDLLSEERVVRTVGVHDALGGKLAQEAGFDALWSSSFEVSASRCLPDASLLSMVEYLQAASNIQRANVLPVVADCDTGYGNSLNVAHMVHEYEAAGIGAVCLEDKVFPKMNSFVGAEHTLLDVSDFTRKITTAKQSQTSGEFVVIARTEALISGLGVEVALARCEAYADAGADAVLVHSKASTNEEILAFLDKWDRRLPVVIVPTTYPDWHVDEMASAGVSVVIYANQGIRSVVAALRSLFGEISRAGKSSSVEGQIAAVSEIFSLQDLREWQQLEP